MFYYHLVNYQILQLINRLSHRLNNLLTHASCPDHSDVFGVGIGLVWGGSEHRHKIQWLKLLYLEITFPVGSFNSSISFLEDLDPICKISKHDTTDRAEFPARVSFKPIESQ